MAVGVLGGAFDPPHNGHLALARAALAQLDLDLLLVLVIEDPGHKAVTTPADVRLELTRLAFATIPEARVELDRHARTVDSLEERRLVDAFLVVGSDELADFWQWKNPERVLELARLAVARRPGVSDGAIESALGRLLEQTRVVFVDMSEMPVSSTEVRARLARGESVDGLVPDAVARAIVRLGVYRGAE